MRDTKATKSYILIISSMLIFGTIGVFRRYIPLSSGMLAFIRGVVGSLFLLVFVKLKGIKLGKDIDRKSLILTIVSGGFIGINWILLFEAFNYTTVATATLCYYMQPTIVIFLSPLVLKEKLGVKKTICAIVSIIGMLFVAGVMDAGQALSLADLRGVFLGLGAAAFYSTVVMLNKMINIENAYAKTIIQLSSAAIILIPYLLLTGEFGTMSGNENINVFVIVMILTSVLTLIATV
ncbi:MAG: DMT family transporter, partial [Lachnospiraceae bacterium]|nr:DMT family transporter [Lachnospiraceae bacterium]